MSSRSHIIHQEYIARIRYSNALPPPPCPPKLLDIPNTGLSSGQYTSAGFASRLAREQPLNIEADAELGMPIDLVGIPGVFDGDESAISALQNPPPLHPADRALMRPPNALGKNTTSASAASFLRRTEYTTSHTAGSSKFESSNSSNTMRVRKKRARANVTEDDPVHISRHILRSFNIAYPEDAYNGPDTADDLRGADILPDEKQAWKAPRHPRNPKLECVGSYPLLPDWDAVPDTGSYMLHKFSAAPINNPNDPSYDKRLDVALLRPLGESIQDHEAFLREQEAYSLDPTLAYPIPRFHFEFFIPSDTSKVRGIKRHLTTNNPDDSDIKFDDVTQPEDDPEGPPRKTFKYEHVRVYETEKQNGDPARAYDDVVALALHDPAVHRDDMLRDGSLEKGAYFYPIAQRTVIRARRPGRVEMQQEPQKVHFIDLAAREPEAEVEAREAVRRRYDPVVEV
ncbi:Paf1-domain-containing protein [Massarina eburnea CBS 473.64]|uniref:Paf1-domain-containing protein n=1 Tax=Massarina eburnea CBS 473.64 TaxID=1395130 RepID=A0A6A6SDC6_9PLEO|nr:Paf1-domain-containing protein [Massarina eburnea CBS 473.64]